MQRWLQQDVFRRRLAEVGAQFDIAALLHQKRASAEATIALSRALADRDLTHVPVLLKVINGERRM